MLNSFSDLGVGLAEDRRGAEQLNGSATATNQLKDRLDEVVPAQPLTELETAYTNLLILDT